MSEESRFFRSSPLLADLYEFTMVDAYLAENMHATAVFELFIRRLPQNRPFLVAAGLEQALDYLQTLSFTAEDLLWLARTGQFRPAFSSYLRDFHFSGDVNAVEEGTPIYANEPLIQVIAPITEAQLVETRLMNLIHFQTLIASKAASLLRLAPDKTWIDFGLRRAHGAEAGLAAARASYLSGFDATSNTLAAQVFGIPSSGTMAHSFIEAHENEEEAFRDFLLLHPRDAILLIDTYDTEAAARLLARILPEMAPDGIRPLGVRLDSGDLIAHAFRVRRIFDEASRRHPPLKDMRIYVSSSMNEERVREIVQSNAPIDGFGVGSNLVTSSDQPYLDIAYKIQEYDGIPRMKFSEGKLTYPGRKQIYRFRGAPEIPDHDLLALSDEESIRGTPLLKPVMRKGKRITLREDLVALRARTRDTILREKRNVPVRLSQGLRELTEHLIPASRLTKRSLDV